MIENNGAMIMENRAMIENNGAMIMENRAMIEGNRAMIEGNRATIEHNGAMIREVQLMLLKMCEQMGLTMELPGSDPKPD